MEETPIRVTLTLPSGAVVDHPDPECIEETLRSNFDQVRTVGDIWLRCRPADFWKDGKVNKEAAARSTSMRFYVGHPGGVVTIYTDNQDVGDYAFIWDENRDVEFEAEDDGGSAWALNERYLMPVEEAAKLAAKLTREHRLSVDKKWIRLLPEW